MEPRSIISAEDAGTASQRNDFLGKRKAHSPRVESRDCGHSHTAKEKADGPVFSIPPPKKKSKESSGAEAPLTTLYHDYFPDTNNSLREKDRGGWNGGTLPP